ncbi:trehalase family glycosidase [Croceiramulus getboli]|nr:trehalase family glycosidase [Flavobacteriaceae bacterium YJPT1-3]
MQLNIRLKETLERLLAQEDTDQDRKITAEDQGPKSFELIGTDGHQVTIEGTYYLSNLLQEIAQAISKGKEEAVIAIDRIQEPPTARISRRIREDFWDDLTRTIDRKGIARILTDDKTEEQIQRIYVPATDEQGQQYYRSLQKDFPGLEVVVLPEKISPSYVKSINEQPGILALALTADTQKGVPFVVPGGRFNEMYGWDSYFEGIGLLIDQRVDLAKAMIDNFCYQIEHYGKILNANRSYYLTRTQPPFLSSFIREVYEAQPSVGRSWLEHSLSMAIREYETVWMVAGERLTNTGLNRYLAQGIGIPPETEPGHFDEALAPYAEKYAMEVSAFAKAYQTGAIKVPELDLYFTHDRSLRESGHDTSWRLDDVCAHLNTVDVNSLLYKYETDFAYLIDRYFQGNFKAYTPEQWEQRAEKRRQLMNSLMWNEKAGQYFDYHFLDQKQTEFESASNFFPLWAGIPSADQAAKMVNALKSSLKERGGIAGTSAAMHARVPSGAVQRQWDYPNGWAPHQMMLWKGLLQYGYEAEAYELIYRWLWMITKNAVDYNGTIPEKYDVVACTHKVYAEYGNVGTQFDYITTSGFGWMNASYQLGINILPERFRKDLDALTDPDSLF